MGYLMSDIFTIQSQKKEIQILKKALAPFKRMLMGYSIIIPDSDPKLDHWNFTVSETFE